MSVDHRDVGDALGQVDRYLLLRELGSGSFGTVFLARDTVALTEVAVKALPDFLRYNGDEMEQIQRNFALVARLHHPHVASLLHLHCIEHIEWFDRDGDRPFAERGDYLVVMEYATGITLSRLQRGFPDKCLPVPQAIAVCRQIASALDFAHSLNVVHRDIKPANVMVHQTADGDLAVKVLDFGLAAEIHSSMTRMTGDSGNTGGTRPYMAPEQWAGKIQDGRADQYALAVSFHELVCGHVPFASIFETNDTLLMLNVVRRELPEPLPQLTASQNAVLLRALSKDPARRYPSCSAFNEALARGDVGAGQGPFAKRSPTRQGKTALWLRPILLGAMSAALAGAVLFMAQQFQAKGRTENVARERVQVELLRGTVQDAEHALERKDLGTARRAIQNIEQGLAKLPPTAPEAAWLKSQTEQLRLDMQTLGIRLAGEALSSARPYYHRIQRIDPTHVPELGQLCERGRTNWEMAEAQLRKGDHVAVTQACAQVVQAAQQAEPIVRAVAARAAALGARVEAPPQIRERAARAMDAARDAWLLGHYAAAETEWQRAAMIWEEAPPVSAASGPSVTDTDLAPLRKKAAELLARVENGSDWNGIWIDTTHADTAIKLAIRTLKPLTHSPDPVPSALADGTDSLRRALAAYRASRTNWGTSLAGDLLAARKDGRWQEAKQLASKLAVGVAAPPLGQLERQWAELAARVADTARSELRPRLAIRTQFKFPGLVQDQGGALVRISPEPRGWSTADTAFSDDPRNAGTTPCVAWLDPDVSYTVGITMERPVPAAGRAWQTSPWKTNLVATWRGVRELAVLLEPKELPDDLVALPPHRAAPAQSQAAQRLRIPIRVRSVAAGLSFALIPPGDMRVLPHGSKKVVRVTLDHPLYCTLIEITRDQWLRVTHLQRLPSVTPFFANAPHDAPMENVSWEEARAFCLALCRAEGVAPGTYRLPSEAEWEYICRAGGPPVGGKEAAIRSLENSSVFYEGAQHVPPRRVGPSSAGKLAPNAWGIHDMLGSVWEWCDVWSYPPSGGSMSPRSPMQGGGGAYISRGGSFLEAANDISSASRRIAPMTRENHTGFRVVRDMPQTPGAVD